MNASNRKFSKDIDYVVIDSILLNLSYRMSYAIHFATSRNPYLHERWRNLAIILTLINIIVVLFFSDDKRRRKGFVAEIFYIAQQVFILELLITFYLYATRSGIRYSRTVLFLTGILLIPLDAMARVIWNRFCEKRVSKKKSRVLIMGSKDLRERVAEAVHANKPRETIVAELEMDEASISRLETILEANLLDSVILLQENSGVFLDAIFLCEKYGCRISVIPSFQAAMSASAIVEPLEEFKQIDFRVSPLDNLENAVLKRSFDIVGSIILLVLTSPLMGLIAVGTKLSSPGPILFRQKRIGRYRKPFVMLKFRTMIVTGTENTGWSKNRDPRKTKFGAIIRKLSIDELPQLWNVLKGDMSLIGPRPEVPYHVEHFKEEIHSYLVRQQVRPGMSGWAQVHGLRGDTSIQDRISYDIWYIENWTFSLDIEIFIRTVFGGMINKEVVKNRFNKNDSELL